MYLTFQPLKIVETNHPTPNQPGDIDHHAPGLAPHKTVKTAMATENTAFPLTGTHEFHPRTGLMALICAESRMQVLTYFFALLLGTGLCLGFLTGLNWNSGEAILLLHIVFGLIFTVLFLV
jgi:hypothetical protein